MDIDIWSDVVCPFCFLGKHRLARALEAFEHRDDVTVRWHSFELDRQAPNRSDDTLVEHIAEKYAITREQAEAQHVAIAAEAADLGLEFNWREAKRGNTFDAHRLAQLAADRGLGDAAVDALMTAYFSDGLPIGERSTLVTVAEQIGLDADEVNTMLDSDEYGNHVRSDEATAKMLGITGVPFFVLDRRYGVSGAQPPEVLLQALTTAWDTKDEPREAVTAGAGPCDGDCCGGACGTAP